MDGTSSSPRFRRIWVAAALVVPLALFAQPVAAIAQAAPARWITGWGEAPMVPLVPDQFVVAAFPTQEAVDQTVRMVVRVTSPATQLRLRLSNRYGDRPLQLGTVRVGHPLAGRAVVAGSQRLVTFHGQPGVTIAPGRDVTSDPVGFPVRAGDEVSVSVFVRRHSGRLTFHRYGNWVTYISAAGAGDRSGDEAGALFPTAADSWFWLVGVDEAGGSYRGTVVVLGDSITDGYPTLPDQHETWPDELAARLEAAPPRERLAVVNAGISGNCLEVASFLPYGESAVRRIGFDALDLAQVRDLIVFEGTNDLGLGAPSRVLIGALQRVAALAHRRGIRVFVGTITPRSDSTAVEVPLEAQRRAVNRWIRGNHVFDGVVDFDEVLRDPIQPGRLDPLYDSGDGVHPNILGLRAMAASVDLARF